MNRYTKKRLYSIWLLLILGFSAQLAAQEFVYVTDSLQLRLYSKPSDTSNIIQSIESGDSVEVLETQSGFSRVSTHDGSVGWVKSAFLVEDPPEKLLYYSVSEENKQLEEQIEALQNNAPDTDTVNEASVNEIKQLQGALTRQQQINQALQRQLDANKVNESKQIQPVSDTYLVVSNNQFVQILLDKIWWFIGLVAALLLTGFLFGVKLSSWRMKKRLHGFRI